MATKTRRQPATFSHVGRRAYTGHYAIGSDAIRTPGVFHALNAEPHGRAYRAVCGVIVHTTSDDHHLDQSRHIHPAAQPATPAITCAKCLRKSGVAAPTDAEIGALRLAAAEAAADYKRTWLADGTRTPGWHERFERQAAARDRLRRALWVKGVIEGRKAKG